MKILNEKSGQWVIPELKVSKGSRRAELVGWFVDNIFDKKGKKYRPARIGMLLSHLKQPDLEYFVSVCKDMQRCKGQVYMQKYFWFSIKVK